MSHSGEWAIAAAIVSLTWAADRYLSKILLELRKANRVLNEIDKALIWAKLDRTLEKIRTKEPL